MVRVWKNLYTTTGYGQYGRKPGFEIRPTSIDNSRLAAIHELGGVDKYGRPIKPNVRIRRPDEPLTPKEKERFTRDKRRFSPETWGEATAERIRGQSGRPPEQKYRLTTQPKVTGRPE